MEITNKNRKIRVGIFVDGDFIPSYDGASNRFHYLSRYLQKNGVDVVVFHGYRGWSDISLIKKEPFKTYIFPIKNYYSNLELIASLLRKESIDIIQFDNLEPILLQGVRLAKLSGAKLVSEMHYVVRNLAKRLGAKQSQISKIGEMEKEVGKSIDHLICLSDQDSPSLQKNMGIPSRAVSVIPSGVDCKEIRYVGSDVKAKNIIFLGNLYFKPNEDAVRIMKSQMYPELRKYGFHFTVAGDCPPRLKKECEEPGFKFIGTLVDLNTLFKDATFAVAPIEEGTGMRIKFLNYLAAGIPVVTTDVATAGFNKKEYFFIENDFSKYAQKIIALLQDEKKLNTVSREGLKAIKRNYDWNVVAKHAIKTYQKIMTDENKKTVPSGKTLGNSEPVWLQEAIDKKRFKEIKTDALPKEFSYAVINKGKVKTYKTERIIAVEGMPGAGKTTFIKKYIHNETASLPQLQIKNRRVLNADTLETSISFLETEDYKTKQINILEEHSKEVVLDRTFITTLAYCYARSKLNGKPEEYASLFNMHSKIKHTITLPTHLVYMDVSVNKSLQRRNAFSRDERYKNWFNPTFLGYLKEFYDIELKKVLPLTPLYIDTSNLTRDEVFRSVKKMLCKK